MNFTLRMGTLVRKVSVGIGLLAMVASTLVVLTAGTWSTVPAACNQVVTVRGGQTLGRLAAAYGTSYQAVAQLNHISDPNTIWPGEQICMRASGGGGGYQSVTITTLASRGNVPSGSSPNSYPFGWCTWGAAHLAHDDVNNLGNADDWLANARRRGMATGSSPRVGATVTYAPYVQGASGMGHVAHVIAVYSNGSFEVEEMDYYGYGGGYGRFSYRLSHTGWGVGFIY